MSIDPGMLSFLAVLIVIVLSPLISRRMRIPTIVLEVCIGIILGRSLLNLIREDPWLDFFSFFGLVYLLFLAGLEIDMHEYLKNKITAAAIASASLIVPFLLGYYIGACAGVDPLLLGTILSTTSIGVVIPLTKEIKDRARFSTILLASTMVVDVVSMLLLTMSIERALNPDSFSFIYSYIIFAILFSTPFIIRRLKITKCISEWFSELSHLQLEVRMCFALIAIFALLAEFIGVHAILGAFLSGLVVSELTHRGSLLEQKLLGFGYGFFVPFFFIIVGATTNLPLLFRGLSNLRLLVLILAAGIGGKLSGMAVAGKATGFSTRESLSLGLIGSARLSLVLAGATIARSTGLIGEALYSVLVIFAMITVLIGPSIAVAILERPAKPRFVYPEIPIGFLNPEEE